MLSIFFLGVLIFILLVDIILTFVSGRQLYLSNSVRMSNTRQRTEHLRIRWTTFIFIIVTTLFGVFELLTRGSSLGGWAYFVRIFLQGLRDFILGISGSFFAFRTTQTQFLATENTSRAPKWIKTFWVSVAIVNSLAVVILYGIAFGTNRLRYVIIYDFIRNCICLLGALLGIVALCTVRNIYRTAWGNLGSAASDQQREMMETTMRKLTWLTIFLVLLWFLIALDIPQKYGRLNRPWRLSSLSPSPYGTFVVEFSYWVFAFLAIRWMYIDASNQLVGVNDFWGFCRCSNSVPPWCTQHCPFPCCLPATSNGFLQLVEPTQSSPPGGSHRRNASGTNMSQISEATAHSFRQETELQMRQDTNMSIQEIPSDGDEVV